MLDFGWQELMVVAFVLVLVVGPKDLPKVLRAIAKTVGKARGMANEFQSSMMEVANQDEFRDVKKALDDARSGRIEDLEDIKDTLEDTKKQSGIVETIDQFKTTGNDLKSSVKKEAEAPAQKAVTDQAAKQAVKKTAPKKKSVAAASGQTAKGKAKS